MTVNAILTGTTNPIVFPTASNFQQDVVPNLPSGTNTNNVAGINAQRDQGDKLCYFFSQAWPSLKSLYYLHFAGYGPSERAKDNNGKGVIQEAKSLGIQCTEWPVTDGNLNLNKLPDGDNQTGLLVLPIDFCIGEGPSQAPSIIQTVQAQVAQGGLNIPTFFPIPDWANSKVPGGTPAFGGYGLSQYNCGKLASDLVFAILWQNAPPSGNIVTAPNSLFELALNQSAATSLNIQLDQRFKRQIRP
jgi:ABC-type uncharacterized transport system substrate-binding protein